MKQRILAALLLRFIPYRTYVGIGLFVVSQAIDTLTSAQFCADAPELCGLATKASLVLVGLGLRDKERK